MTGLLEKHPIYLQFQACAGNKLTLSDLFKKTQMSPVSFCKAIDLLVGVQYFQIEGGHDSITALLALIENKPAKERGEFMAELDQRGLGQKNVSPFRVRL